MQFIYKTSTVVFFSEINSATEKSNTRAQTPVTYNLPVSCTLRKQYIIKSSRDSYQYITNCTTIDKKLVFTNSTNNRLVVVDADCRSVRYMPLYHVPEYITKIGSTTVGVSCTTDNVILLIDISTYSIVHTVNTSGHCYGISYNNNHLYVIIGKTPTVMNLAGKVKRTLPSISHKIKHIIASRKYLICTNSTTIFYFSMKGSVIWMFKYEKYKTFRGITTDQKGNVYVTDEKTDTVIAVSDDGKHREILRKSDGLNKPIGIYFDKKDNSLLVCNCKCGMAYTFDVTFT